MSECEFEAFIYTKKSLSKYYKKLFSFKSSHDLQCAFYNIMHLQLDFLAVKALMVTCDNDTQLGAPFWCMGGVIMPGVSDCQ